MEYRDLATLLQVISEVMWSLERRSLLICGRVTILCETVNHSINFVSPNDPNVHTQTIESHWAKIKRDMRRRIGRMAVSTFETYLVEYVWRNTFPSDNELYEDFLLFLSSIKFN